MKIFFQLIIAFIFFKKIKSGYKELTKGSSISIARNEKCYINLNKLGNVGTIYLNILSESSKDSSRPDNSIYLSFLESNDISINDITLFKTIESISRNSKTIYGTYIYTQHW